MLRLNLIHVSTAKGNEDVDSTTAQYFMIIVLCVHIDYV